MLLKYLAVQTACEIGTTLEIDSDLVFTEVKGTVMKFSGIGFHYSVQKCIFFMWVSIYYTVRRISAVRSILKISGF